MAETDQKQKSRLETYSSSGKITARIMDFDNGIRIFDDLSVIRIKSKDYSLLIMEDYFPMIGQVDGTVDLLSTDNQIRLGKIKGFYMHRENEFSLIVEEDSSGVVSEG